MRRSTRNSTLAAVCALAALVTVLVRQSGDGDVTPRGGESAVYDGGHDVRVSGDLGDVRVREPGSLAGYSRTAFDAEDWPPTGDGCDLRDRIIVRDSTDQRGERPGNMEGGCYPDNPHLLSPYRGSVQDGHPPGPVWLDGRRAVQIDHVVPLGWAWRQGADDWSAGKRARLAVDLDNLVASGSHDNASKNDEGPSTWSPEIGRCSYARHWVVVLTRYHLTVGRADRAALAAMLKEC